MGSSASVACAEIRKHMAEKRDDGMMLWEEARGGGGNMFSLDRDKRLLLEVDDGGGLSGCPVVR